jgi:hypothetical protein
MGAAFGLLSLLITVAIILYMMAGTGYMGAVSKQNTVARQQINVMSGKDPTGQKLAIDSIHTRVDRTGPRPKLIAAESSKAASWRSDTASGPGTASSRSPAWTSKRTSAPASATPTIGSRRRTRGSNRSW